MNKIFIGFSASNSFFAKAIRYISKSNVSHAYIRFYDSHLGMYMVMEASWAGFRIVPFEKFIKRTTIVFEFGCKVDLSNSVKWAAKSLSNPYDWHYALFSAILGWLRRKIHNPFKSPKKWHCTEAVVRMLQYSNIANDLDAESVWPDDLLNYCKNNSNFVESPNNEKNIDSN